MQIIPPGGSILHADQQPYSSVSYYISGCRLVAAADPGDGHMFAAHGFTTCVFDGCEFSAPDGSGQAVFQYGAGGGHGLGFVVEKCTLLDDMAGRWLAGVPAGTNTNTLIKLAYCNLATV